MNLHELGEMFRIERERHGLTQMDVAQQTKISISNIKAIEQGRREALPHPVYAKGFVKNYARLLGLNEDELADVMNKEYHVDEDDLGDSPGMDKPVTMHHRTPAHKKSRLPVLLLLLILLAALAGLMWYAVSERQAPEPQATVEEQVEAPAAPAPAPEPEAIAPEPDAAPEAPDGEPLAEEQPLTMAPQQDAAVQGASEPEEQALETSGPRQTQAAQTEQPEQAGQQEQSEEAVAAGPAVEQSAEGYEVVVRAFELCWIYGVIDQDEATDVTLRPGDSKTFNFEESLSLKLGNAGGVDVFLNGEKHEFDAVSGQVKTLVFP